MSNNCIYREKVNCESGPDSCPWILNAEGNATKCLIFTDAKIREKISKMVYGIKNREILTFNDLSFNVNPIKSKVRVIRNFCQSKEDIMWLISPNGTGKTHILQALLYYYMTIGYECSYIRAKELRSLWITRDSNHEKYLEDNMDLILQNFQESRFRFIDEVGGEGITKSDHFETNFIELLKSGNRKIILASNLEPTEVFADNRTLSILKGAAIVRWKGVDYRSLNR